MFSYNPFACPVHLFPFLDPGDAGARYQHMLLREGVIS
jgi:hypothetical protein